MDVFNSIDVRHRFFQGDLLWTDIELASSPTCGWREQSASPNTTSARNSRISWMQFSMLHICRSGHLACWADYFGVRAALQHYYRHKLVFWATPFTGWAPIMIAILLTGGLIMIMLGVIGEYVWRINEEVRQTPELRHSGAIPMSSVPGPIAIDGIECYSPAVANCYEDYRTADSI